MGSANREQTWAEGTSEIFKRHNSRFYCTYVFWFPPTRSLDGFLATWNMTHHPLFWTCGLLSYPAPYGPACLQTPKSLSRGQRLFFSTRAIISPFFLRGIHRRWWAITANADFTSLQKNKKLESHRARLAQLLIHASWQSGGGNYEWRQHRPWRGHMTDLKFPCAASVWSEEQRNTSRKIQR